MMMYAAVCDLVLGIGEGGNISSSSSVWSASEIVCLGCCLLFKASSFLRNISIFDCHVKVVLVVFWIFWRS